jgi:ABC-2 type transport system permease protein
MKLLTHLIRSCFWALLLKEINQLIRNKQLLVLLIITPTVYLMTVGFSLNDDVKLIPLKVSDQSNTVASRELIAMLNESGIFTQRQDNTSPQLIEIDHLSNDIHTGKTTVGLVIPPTFDRDLDRGEITSVQAFVDGVDAATGLVVSAYLAEIVNHYDQRFHPDDRAALIDPQVTILYNPRLISYWFIVPAILGLILTLVSSVAATNSVILEKEAGTLEQLLMTPASAWEIILAKITPLVGLMMGDMVISVGAARIIFELPFRGNFWLFIALVGLYTFVGIGLGMLVGTLAKGHLQATLSSFFINIPIGLLAGAVTPLEAMPPFFQIVSLFNPLRYYVSIMRSLLLKGVGLEVLLPDVLALIIFAIFLLSLSVNRLYKQFT